MYLVKVSTNGQVTVPAEIRHQLDLRTGDKILFVEKPNGEILFAKAAVEPSEVGDTFCIRGTNRMKEGWKEE